MFGRKKRKNSNVKKRRKNSVVTSDMVLKSDIFGVSMLKEETQEDITAFLFESMDFIEGQLDKEGIFRKSGDHSKKVALLKKMDSGKEITRQMIKKTADVYVVCDLLKDFFKKLPDPVMKNVYSEILSNLNFQLTGKEVIRNRVSEVLQPFQIVLMYRLFKLLNAIAKQQMSTKMGASNLALLFTAILYKRPLMEFMKEGDAYKRGIAVTTVFIDSYDYFFGHVFKGSFASNTRLAFKIFLLGSQE